MSIIKQKIQHLNDFRLLAVVIVGVVLSIFVWQFAAIKLKQQTDIQFERQSEPLVNALKLRVQSLALGLYGARTVPLMAHGELKPQHFKQYVAQLNLDDVFPGALGVGFIRRVELQDVAAFVLDQQHYRPEYQLRAKGPNAGTKYVIQFIEPLQGNEVAIGLDIASEPIRKAAAVNAMNSAEMAMTAPIQLVQAGKKSPGFLILLPYYLPSMTGDENAAAKHRADSLIGWVYAPVLMSKLVAGLNDYQKKTIDFEVYSGKELKPEFLLYDDDSHHELGASQPEYRNLRRQVELALGGQTWTVVMSSNDSFAARLESWLPLGLLLFGLAITALIAATLLNAARLKEKAQSLAEAMSLHARQREIQLDAVIDSTPDVIVTADQQGTILGVNRSVTAMFGFAADEVVGKNIKIFMPADLALKHDDFVAQYHYQNGASVMSKGRELWARHAHGHLIPIEVNLNQFHIDEATFLVAQIRDVSKRLASEQALRANQRQLSMIVEASGLGIWDLDLRTGESFFGGMWGEMLGFVTQELIPSVETWRSLLHPDDLPLAEASLTAHLAGQSAIHSCELRMKTAQGTWKWVHAIGRVYERDEQGAPIKIAGIHLDIDARKHNELMLIEQDTALTHLQQQLRSVVNSATEICIIATDIAGEIQLFNVGAEKMLGYSAESVMGILTPEVFHDAGELASRAQSIAAQTGQSVSGFDVLVYMARQGGSDTHEWTYVCQDGSRLTVNLIVTARYDDAGGLIGYLGVATDVTEQKHINAALELAIDQAVAASQAKSDFLANMSHEIRTPMNAVIGFSTLLADTPLNAVQLEFVGAIQQSGDALLSLINDILDFSKIEAGHLQLEQIEFDVRYLLEGALDIVAEKAAKQALDLACIINPNVPLRLIGDPSRLRQVVLNLLNNAIKFTAQGEVVARLVAMPNSSAARCVLRFSVKDTGIGMSESAQVSLFRPFCQADASTTRRFGGTGLGLSICKRLIEAMAGEVGVVSVLGEGSEFWFEVVLPVAKIEAPPPSTALALQGLRVLVVDDFAANRELIALQLTSFGMLSECFHSPHEALAVLAQAPTYFSLALIDLQLPDLDGLQLARQIQAIVGETPLPLVLLTSMAVPGLAAEAKAAGYSAFLTKPVRQTQLLHVIEEALKMRQFPRGTQHLVTAHHLAEQIAASRPYLLLAEDNPINQKVAVLMLEKFGCRVDVVENGALAVAAVEQRRYDMVLMDCQMPEMDGFVATQTIRALPPEQAGVYIVALTANAFQSDVDHCYAVGMDDFVAKPIHMTEISLALQRGLAKSGRLARLDPQQQEPEDDMDVGISLELQQELLDIDRMFNELKQAVGMDMKEELLALFFPTLDECISGLSPAIVVGDSVQMVSLAHKLKGAAAQLGATKMATYCKAIEMAAKNNDFGSAMTQFALVQSLGLGLSKQLRV
ncbi:PAS domain S-box protein [uncultured Deefgea sp.]|uniref:PAS domain-containing hybrid sensor histidine kinase/response regulator n=1 Tax=uncultured Deefgea sp. TaxID=1304914 RepID=UPI0025956004|nr:PAS domain S-box protein [uncultured Deefgea sp.]